MARSNGRTGLKTSTTRLMLLPSRLKLDHHTDLLFSWKLLHIRERNSRILHLPLLFQSTELESKEVRLLLTEETDSPIWE